MFLLHTGKREGCTAGGGGHRPFPVCSNRRCVADRQAGQNPLRVTPGVAGGERKRGREVEGVVCFCWMSDLLVGLFGSLVEWLVGCFGLFLLFLRRCRFELLYHHAVPRTHTDRQYYIRSVVRNLDADPAGLDWSFFFRERVRSSLTFDGTKTS